MESPCNYCCHTRAPRDCTDLFLRWVDHLSVDIQHHRCRGFHCRYYRYNNSSYSRHDSAGVLSAVPIHVAHRLGLPSSRVATSRNLGEAVWYHLPSGSLAERLVAYMRINPDRRKSWRDRDFASGGEDVVGKGAADTLGGTEVCFRVMDNTWVNVDQQLDETTCRNKALGDLAALHRAFTSIHETSQNERLLKTVEQCAAKRITDTCPPLALLAFDFSVTCQALNMDPKRMRDYLDHLYDLSLDNNDQVAHASLRHDCRDKAHVLQDRLWELRHTRPYLLSHLARTLSYDLNKLLSSVDLKRSYRNEASARFLMRIAALCVFVAWQADDERTFTDCLVPRFNELVKIPSSLPGLTSTIFELVSLNPESFVEHRQSLPFCP